jgi:hypothetical protein
MFTHQWNAMGGYSTVFLGGTTSYAALNFSSLYANGTPLATPLASAAGLRSLIRNAAMLSAPASVGVFVGICVFGDVTQFMHLL